MEIRLACQARRIASRGQLITKILCFRLFYLLCMIVSSVVIPEHNPGDDVLRFDLRLKDSSPCFCLVSQSCADSAWTGLGGGLCHGSSPSSLRFYGLWMRLLSPFTKWDAARFLNIALRQQSRNPPMECIQGDDFLCDFTDSEQVHAFLPLFPIILRSAAICWMNLAPDFLLPPTYECLLVLTGIFFNILCLLLGCLAMYSLTLSVLPAALKSSDRHYVATSACLIYGIWNPASVFFATNYSESLFGALLLSGHAAFARNMYWLALPCWMLGSWTRSNGTISAIWLVVQALGCMCHYIRNRSNFISMTVTAILCLGGATLIVLPIRYHDLNGYRAHCENVSPIQPSWCENESSSFSLYAWTQRHHWNIGPFRYYEARQIPNFLLAAPMLSLSIAGVIGWIGDSMMQFGRGKLPHSPYLLLIGWPLDALSSFSERIDANIREDESAEFPYAYLIHNSSLLGHYAILGILTILGLVMAHVQISTRMIMSSTPAIVWFLTYCHLQTTSTVLRQFVSSYTLLFMLLGVILHVNFLPWT